MELRRRILETIYMRLQHACGSDTSIHSALLVTYIFADFPHIVLSMVRIREYQ